MGSFEVASPLIVGYDEFLRRGHPYLAVSHPRVPETAA